MMSSYIDLIDVWACGNHLDIFTNATHCPQKALESDTDTILSWFMNSSESAERLIRRKNTDVLQRPATFSGVCTGNQKHTQSLQKKKQQQQDNIKRCRILSSVFALRRPASVEGQPEVGLEYK